MCRGFRQFYEKCGHDRGQVYYDRCLEAIGIGRRCQEVVIDREPKIIRDHKVCVGCYRNYEKEVFAFHNKQIEYTQSELQRAEEALRDNQMMDEDTRKALKRQAKNMAKAITKYVEKREEQLLAFRQEQGVWGDG